MRLGQHADDREVFVACHSFLYRWQQAHDAVLDLEQTIASAMVHFHNTSSCLFLAPPAPSAATSHVQGDSEIWRTRMADEG